MSLREVLRRKVFQRVITSVRHCSDVDGKIIEFDKLGGLDTPHKSALFFQPCVRRQVDVHRRLQWTEFDHYTHPVNHPKVRIIAMENKFLRELLQLHEKEIAVTEHALSKLYGEAIKDHEGDQLNPQMIVNILTSFLSQYNMDWIRREVIPLVPNVTDNLGGYCSLLVMQLCVAAYTWNANSLTKQEDGLVCRLLDRLGKFETQNKCTFQQDIIAVIAGSSRWVQEADNLLKDKVQLYFFGPTLIRRAMQSKEYDRALKILETVRHRPTDRTNSAFSGFSKCVADMVSQLPDNYIPRLVEAIFRSQLEISSDSATFLVERWNLLLTSQSDVQAQSTKLNASGHCWNCGQLLDTDTITQQDIDVLKQEFYEKKLTGEQKYHVVADPRSLSAFISWLERRPPYDLVIDGMNAFFNSNKRMTAEYEKTLFVVTKYVNDIINYKEGQKVLIVTKRNALHWIPKDIQQRCDIHIAKGEASDDVFTLYAALSSGPHCYVMSSDIFRDHRDCLRNLSDNDKCLALFMRWQRLRQIVVSREITQMLGSDSYSYLVGDKSYGYPLQTVATPVCHQGTYHIPVSNHLLFTAKSRYPFTQNWLCLPVLSSS